MTAILESMNSGDRFVLLLVSVIMTCATLVPVATVAFVQWRKVREREAATGLVHDMLARGFTSEEIDRVMVSTNVESNLANSVVAMTKAKIACRS